jgi:hypothetical protein
VGFYGALLFLRVAAPVLLLTPPGAHTIEVEVVDPAGEPVPGAVVVAEPRATASPDGVQPLSARSEEGLATLALEPGVWRLTARRQNRWCWPRDVTIPAGTVRAGGETLVLWPMGTIGGALTLPAGETNPGEVLLRVRRDTDPESWGRTLNGEVVFCPVSGGGRWECEVPAGTSLDLELHVDPFAPAYFWGRSVDEGQTLETGSTRLVRGASLSGWAVEHGARRPESRARIELRAPGGGVLEERRGKTAALTASVNADGFFQMLEVTPGRYQLAATAGGLGSASTDVEVREGVETRLRGALVLRPPASLHLSVIPVRHPDGRAWRVRLMAAEGSPGRFAVWDEVVAEDGTWHGTDLPAGKYTLTVVREDGGIWYSADLELEPGADDRELPIEMTRVSGTVTVGDAPLEDARVRVSERDGKVRAPFRTDAEGRFDGLFPSVNLDTARWEAHVTTVEPARVWRLSPVEPESASGHSVSFLLEISDTSIRGRVVDEDGKPQRAFVRAMPQTGDEGHSTLETSSDETTGEFAVVGVVPGAYRVVAVAPAPGGVRKTLSSPAVPVRVREDESPSPLRLVVREQSQVTGRVTTFEGVSVPGAQVAVFPTDYPGTGARPVRTDVEGYFAAEIPPGTRTVLIDISSPGVGRRFLGGPVPGDGPLHLDIDPSGRLVFDLGDPERAGPPTALVYHDGAWVPLSELARWGRLNGETAEPGVVGVPLLHAGEYRVCSVASAAESHELRAGKLTEPRCDEGTLWPGSELWLRVPAALQ